MRSVLGLDPGSTGGACIIWENHNIQVVRFSKISKQQAAAQIKAATFDYLTFDDAVVFIEQVSNRPGEGGSSVFTFGRNLGWLEGVLDCCAADWTPIQPQVWQRAFGLGASFMK